MLFELKNALRSPEPAATLGEDRQVLNSSQPGAERRREPRYLVEDIVEVELMSAPTGRYTGVVRDISRSGMRLELRTPITRGGQIKIIFPKQLVVFGEIRYCHREGSGYQAGVLIDSAFSTQAIANRHLHDDELALYLVGKGLTVPEVIRLREHLSECPECQIRLKDTASLLKPVRAANA